MISEKQLEANRANALLSTGPKTDAGRKRSSMNALRHGITGQVSTMADEDRAAHDKLFQALIKDLAPEGAMEIQLAQRIATDSWRLNRISAVEDNLFVLGQLEHGGEACPNGPELNAALLKLSEMKGLEYIPARDGFGFSNDQIHAAIDRDQRLQRASTADFSKYRTRNFQTTAA
jgi:hypothetical protein